MKKRFAASNILNRINVYCSSRARRRSESRHRESRRESHRENRRFFVLVMRGGFSGGLFPCIKYVVLVVESLFVFFHLVLC